MCSHEGTMFYADALFNFVGEALERIVGYCPSLARAAYALDDFVTRKIFCHAVSFGNKQN